VVRSDGEILGANAAGRRLMASTMGVAAMNGRLSESAGPKLAALFEGVRDAIRDQRATDEMELSLSQTAVFAMRALPLGPALDAALLIVRPREPHVIVSARVRFGFTASESLVAERLARGLTVPQIALQLGISIETVRCHLKQAFVKAGVHRQAELVAVMLGG